VFIDGEFIGGGDATAELAASGKLEIILKEKGIM
jgi:glutaredoxin-related protein